MLHLKYTALKILTNTNKFKNKNIKQSELDITTILSFISFPWILVSIISSIFPFFKQKESVSLISWKLEAKSEASRENDTLLKITQLLWMHNKGVHLMLTYLFDFFIVENIFLMVFFWFFFPTDFNSWYVASSLKLPLPRFSLNN